MTSCKLHVQSEYNKNRIFKFKRIIYSKVMVVRATVRTMARVSCNLGGRGARDKDY